MRAIVAGLLFMLLAACSGDDTGNNRIDSDEQWLISPGRVLVADIRRTTGGVPHIRADSLEDVSFGNGYVQALDNVCQLAETFVKVRSERSLYFGPGENNENIVSDFSYKVLRLIDGAARDLPQLSVASRALISGFVSGYNQYVTETAAEDLPSQCQSQPWVKTITMVDLLAYYRLVAQYASGDLFTDGGLFLAVPPGVSAEPRPVDSTASITESTLNGIDAGAPLHEHNFSGGVAASARRQIDGERSYLDTSMASNVWGLGSELTEQGRGALLANPHFPYTGARRFYQTHLTVPGYLDVNGAGLLGTALPLIAFNENLAWSHTVSTGRRFTAYELALAVDDNLSYVKDGQTVPITAETFEIFVSSGGSTPIRLQRDFYFSEYGPMLAADLISGGALGEWGANRRAYTYRDVNENVTNILDTWLRLARASNLTEFQQVFRECGSTLWTNTGYADKDGNAWYIDSSSVPNLSAASLQALQARRDASLLIDGFFNRGVVLLDGSTSRDDWVEAECNGRVPYESMPKLQRADFVQNSNDSHWASNPAAPLEGYSVLYGEERSELSVRTRLGLKMLQNPLDSGLAEQAPAGQDGRFSARDLIDVIYNNRAWYAETLLGELLERCDLIGSEPVNRGDGSARVVDVACQTLTAWNGTFDTDSIGAPLFRLFMVQYGEILDSELTVPFDPDNPTDTPSTPITVNRGTADDTMLSSLARAMDVMDSTGMAIDASLGEVQVVQNSGGVPPLGEPRLQGDPIAWHGSFPHIEGGFNAIDVSDSPVADDTRFPRINSPKVPGTAGISTVPGEYWQIGRGTSWHFGIEFTDAGPEAYGLLSYSQSTDEGSAFFNDQSLRYSMKDYRPLLLREADIVEQLLPEGELTLTGNRWSD